MGEDEDYDQLVINWDGEEIIGRGKFNIVEDMGDGQSALVLATDTNGPVLVYKLPTGGL
jgi:hypothetical protein